MGENHTRCPQCKRKSTLAKIFWCRDCDSDPHGEPQRIDTLTGALHLVLEFYSAGEWTERQREHWKDCTDEPSATTRVLADEIRMRLGLLPSHFGDLKGERPTALPADMPLGQKQKWALDRILKFNDADSR